MEKKNRLYILGFYLFKFFLNCYIWFIFNTKIEYVK